MSKEENISDSHVSPLRAHVFLSLLIQIMLSLALLGLSMLNDRTVQVANEFSMLAMEKKISFHKVGQSSSRLMEEVRSEQPNPRLIRRLQDSLLEHGPKLRNMSDQLFRVTSGDARFSMLLIQSEAQSHEVALRELNAFLDDLETLGSIDPDALLYAEGYANRINLAISPTGTIARGVDALTNDVERQADVIVKNLMIAHIVIVVVMISIVLALGIFLILPALRNLALSLEREQTLRKDLESMARRDHLTGLINRTGMDKVIADLVDGQSYALAIVDLNDFKPINDTFGHAYGDAVLVEVARRMQVVAIDATVARLGGDEFAVLDTNAGAGEDCTTFGSRLSATFREPICHEDRCFDVSASIGVAHSSELGEDYGAVCSAADAAMYTLKGSGETRFGRYTPELATQVFNLDRRTELQEALRASKIHPWYQPKVALKTRELTGFEALARWEHPTKGLLFPGDFLPEIERYNLHLDLSLSMLRQALVQLRDWELQGFVAPQLAVNISPDVLALEQGLEEMLWLFSEYKDVCDLLTIEITEDVFIGRTAGGVRRSIDKIIEHGLQVSIDDFGCGYASFRHLREFPLHELKIDQSFVADIGLRDSSSVILNAFVSIADGLGAKVVAEGIETEQQRNFLISIGCSVGQGRLFAWALNADDATQWLDPVKISTQG